MIGGSGGFDVKNLDFFRWRELPGSERVDVAALRTAPALTVDNVVARASADVRGLHPHMQMGPGSSPGSTTNFRSVEAKRRRTDRPARHTRSEFQSMRTCLWQPSVTILEFQPFSVSVTGASNMFAVLFSMEVARQRFEHRMQCTVSFASGVTVDNIVFEVKLPYKLDLALAREAERDVRHDTEYTFPGVFMRVRSRTGRVSVLMYSDLVIVAGCKQWGHATAIATFLVEYLRQFSADKM